MASKYDKGEKITTIEELMQQEFIWWSGKVYHRGWFMSWPLQQILRYMSSGWIYKAVPKAK